VADKQVNKVKKVFDIQTDTIVFHLLHQINHIVQYLGKIKPIQAYASFNTYV
jgi:hypothetical protein